MAENVKVPPFTEAPETVVGSTPQTEFGFDFPFWESADILVYVDGVLLDSADYSVEGLALQDGVAVVGGYGSGTVTLDTAVSNVTVTIDRLVVGDRETQFSTSSPLGMRALNADLNRLTARQQDLRRRQAALEALGLDAEEIEADAAQAAADSAAAAASAAAALVSEQNAALAAEVPIYPSVANAQAATVPAGVKSIRTQFRAPTYADLGTLIGGGDYARASLADITGDSYPAAAYFRSTDRYMPDGTTDATNGGYWLLMSDKVDPAMLGAAQDGGDDAAAIDAALAVVAARGRGAVSLARGATYGYWHGDGNVPDDNILGDNVIIEGNGATINGAPADGVIGNDRYNQFYAIFRGTSRTGLTVRNLRVRGALTTASLYGCTNVRFDRWDDDGKLTQNAVNTLTITGISQANPGVVTYTGTDPADGDYFVLTGISGMTEMNDRPVRARSIDTSNPLAKTFVIRDVDNVVIDTSGFTAYTSGGTATLCTNWLRDKGVYLDECDDVVFTAPRIRNLHAGIYAIGDQVSTRCGTVKVIGGDFEIDAIGYTAFFPAGVYWADVEDAQTQGCTFRNYCSSVLNGSTGTGMGYGFYEGDGNCGSVKSIGDNWIAESSGDRGWIGAYVSEPQAGTFIGATFDVQSGANFSALVRLDAKRYDTSYVIHGLIATVAAGVDCYGVHVVGATDNTRAPDVSLTGSTIVGGAHALRVEGLGNGSVRTADNNFDGQTSVEGSVYYTGYSTIPLKNISMRGDRITGGQGPGVLFNAYCLNPKLDGVTILDGNLSDQLGDGGGAGAAVRMQSGSQGLKMRGCTVSGAKFPYVASSADSAASRIFKDVIVANDIGALRPGYGAPWHRFHTSAPTSGIYNIGIGDLITNADLGAGEAPGWYCASVLRPALAADASSASATITIEAGYASSLAAGDIVLLTKSADPYDGSYVSDYHLDTIDSINVGANQVTLATGIDPGLGTFVAGTATLTFARLKAAASIAA